MAEDLKVGPLECYEVIGAWSRGRFRKWRTEAQSGLWGEKMDPLVQAYSFNKHGKVYVRKWNPEGTEEKVPL